MKKNLHSVVKEDPFLVTDEKQYVLIKPALGLLKWRCYIKPRHKYLGYKLYEYLILQKRHAATISNWNSEINTTFNSVNFVKTT